MSPLEGRRPRALAGATGLAALCALALASAWSDGTARAAPRAMTAAPDFDAAARAVRATLADLVAADTSNPPGNESRAARIAAKRLEKAGIPFEIDAFAPGRENLVARLRGDGTRRPLLLLAHTDVVGAEGQSWTSDPHRMVERDGFLVGRGVLDDLGMAAVALEVVILLHAQRAPLARDVVLAWTGDEESGGLGIRWQLEHRPETIDAEIALNEGGAPILDEAGRVKLVEMQAAEKLYQDYTIRARGPTGHSSVPVPGNAIYRLARALDRLAQHQFPARLLPVTRAWLSARAPLEPPERAQAMSALAETKDQLPPDALRVVEADPTLAATLRTTCVATMLGGGTRVNALPAEATANVNCRILPDETADDVQRQLAEVFADPELAIEPSQEFGHATPSPLEGAVPDAVRKVAPEVWPGAAIVPFMGRGATDSRHVRAHGVAAYGLGPIAVTENDARRAHGIDERIPAASLRPAVEFFYRLVVALAGADGGAVHGAAAAHSTAP
ncbi:MAG TPA: M20/M25/M40 family metallo-hydrolase [Candidatus Binatia bacterium]|nr:M20/M25/M40 family metallo-hydrolase [Candidatus Binatia bacterium]